MSLSNDSMLKMSNLRSESHVAQQSRRDKLRYQQNLNPCQHLQDYTNGLEQLSVHQRLNQDFFPLRNIRYGDVDYDPNSFPSEMIDFSANSQVTLAHKDAMVVPQELDASQLNKSARAVDASFGDLAHPISSNLNTSVKVSGLQQGYNWIVNNSCGSAGGIENNQNPMFFGEGLSGALKLNNISASSSLYMKPSYCGYQDVHSAFTNPSSENSSQNSIRHFGEMHGSSPPLYSNTLQDVNTVASGTQGLEMSTLVQHNMRSTVRDSWADGGNELLLLPTYDGQSNPLCVNSVAAGAAMMNRPAEGSHQWGGELGIQASKSTNRYLSRVANDGSNTQALSLSLSSVPQSDTHVGQFGERCNSEDPQSRTVECNDLSSSKAMRPDYLYSSSKQSMVSKVYGGTQQDMAGSSAFAHRTTGPLGPFTGYATILKNSKFLKPAQQLLEEFCCANGPKASQTCGLSEKFFDKVGTSDTANIAEPVFNTKIGDLGASSLTFNGSNEISTEAGGASCSTESCRPEYQHKKARLLFMQEEVCRRYRQYHQQMQMVVSSFESVAGLNAATPYVSLALKTVSKHFRSLRNAISDQLRHIRNVLGEDLSSPTAGTSSNKGDASTSRLKFIDQTFQKHKAGGNNLGFYQPQHVWRPQRGLPEKAVTILRAWLFDHFLHPYPTDTDKHMLATQTGLSRNQVSNWFINARVRLWKPMVEEIHMLETKGMAETNSKSGKGEWKPVPEGSSGPNNNSQQVAGTSDKPFECSGIGSSGALGTAVSEEIRNQEKRSRVSDVAASMDDGSLISFMPYHRSGLEIGGLGAVSLTLGLRQTAESAQQQQHLQQQEQLRQRLGNPMIRDFVG